MQASRVVDSYRKLSPAKRRPASFGALLVCLLLGTATFAACGDDGNVLGSDGSAGSLTQMGGSAGSGGSSSTAHAGSMSNAGNGGATSTGGATGTAGTTSTGGATSAAGTTGTGGATCKTGLCSRPNTCVDECGGRVVYTGCCMCTAPAVDQRTCDMTGSGGASSTDCVGATCAADQACVAYRTVGGAIPPAPDTNGKCDTGRHAEGNRCEADFAYTCAALTGCSVSAPAATCRCATGSSCSNTTVCRLPTASSWLDSSADLVCELQAP